MCIINVLLMLNINKQMSLQLLKDYFLGPKLFALTLVTWSCAHLLPLSKKVCRFSSATERYCVQQLFQQTPPPTTCHLRQGLWQNTTYSHLVGRVWWRNLCKPIFLFRKQIGLIITHKRQKCGQNGNQILILTQTKLPSQYIV